MSVSRQESGMRLIDIEATEKVAKEKDTFIFIRPTNTDCTLLIEEGFATKSMDIHHKSSNWGPMAGMVPFDPAFSKAAIGSPKVELARPGHAADPDHAHAYITQLKLPEALRIKFENTKITQRLNW